MKLLTLLAVTAVAAGVYHYRQRRGLGARRVALPGSDYRMEQAVRTAVAGKAAGAVDVRCINGVVTLRGTLGATERDRVLAAALGVPGVRQVTNLLDVTDPLGDLGPMQSGIATGV